MEVFYFTGKGNRATNEDSLLLNSKLLTSKNMKTTKKFNVLNLKYNKFLIADGIGGFSKGEIASSGVLSILKKINRKFNQEILKNLIYNSKEYLKYLSLTQNINRLGSTVAGVLLTSENKNYAFNIGDSRIYKLSFKNIELLSYDHSLGMELVEMGLISSKFLRYHKSRNVLTSSITNKMPINKINYKEFIFNKNEILLICSDGVWEQLEEEDLLKLYKKYKSIEEFVKILFSLIKTNPADNISFIVIKK